MTKKTIFPKEMQDIFSEEELKRLTQIAELKSGHKFFKAYLLYQFLNTLKLDYGVPDPAEIFYKQRDLAIAWLIKDWTLEELKEAHFFGYYLSNLLAYKEGKK